MRLKLLFAVVSDASKHLLEEPCRFLLSDKPHQVLPRLAHKDRLREWASSFRHVVVTTYAVYCDQCPDAVRVSYGKLVAGRSSSRKRAYSSLVNCQGIE